MELRDAIKLIKAGRPVLVKVEDHHQPYEYLATTEDELRNALLAVVADRADYYEPPEEPEMPELTAEQVSGLPPGRIRDAALEQVAAYERRTASYQKDRDAYGMLEGIGRDGDMQAAWRFLRERRHYEDEGVNFVEALRARAFKPFKVAAEAASR